MLRDYLDRHSIIKCLCKVSRKEQGLSISLAFSAEMPID